MILRLVHCDDDAIQVKSIQTRAAAPSPNQAGGGTPIPSQEGGFCEGSGAAAVGDSKGGGEGGESVKEEGGGGGGGVAGIVGISSHGSDTSSAGNGRLSDSGNAATANRGIAGEEARRRARGGWGGGAGAPLFSYAFHTGLAPVVGSIDDAGNSTREPPGWLEEGKGKREGEREHSGVITLARSDLDIHANDTRLCSALNPKPCYNSGEE